MRLARLLWIVTALAFTGCHKKEKTPAPGSVPAPAEAQATVVENDNGQPAVPVASQPDPPPPPPSQVVLARAENAVRQSVVGEVDASLTAELRAFIQQKHRMPATFAEFAGLRLDTIPRPPAGKKWVIDTESLEVKAVAGQ